MKIFCSLLLLLKRHDYLLPLDWKRNEYIQTREWISLARPPFAPYRSLMSFLLFFYTRWECPSLFHVPPPPPPLYLLSCSMCIMCNFQQYIFNFSHHVTRYEDLLRIITLGSSTVDSWGDGWMEKTRKMTPRHCNRNRSSLYVIFGSSIFNDDGVISNFNGTRIGNSDFSPAPPPTTTYIQYDNVDDDNEPQ